MKSIVVSFTIIILPFLGSSQQIDVPHSNYPEYPWLNKKLPLDTLLSYTGDTLILFKTDKNYVISFWFTNCPPCVAEISWLNQLKQDYSKQDIEFIAISFDEKEEVDRFLKSTPFDFDLYHLKQNILNQRSLTMGYPTNLILDKQGMVLFQHSGGSADPDKAKKIYDLLAEELEKRLKN